MQKLRTVILAAGKGTRMQSDVPKVLHKVCGRPIIEYVLGIANQVGSSKNFVVLGHKIELVKKYLDESVAVVHQKRLLGTADAVKEVEKYNKSFSGDILILCGDTPLLNKTVIKNLIRKHKKSNAACTFLTSVIHEPSGYGRVIRDDKGRAIAIREDKDAVGFERDIIEINVGVYVFKSSELFKALKQIKLNAKKKEYYLTDIVELLTDEKLKIETLETDDHEEGLGVNSKEDLAKAESVIRSRVLKDFMDKGVTIIDPSTTYINLGVRIGRDTVINPFTFIESNVKIGNNCTVGPFARLREGTKIGNRVEVGNFTEISRTTIGDKSFVKHFSYLGDASVGSKVNIGAGVVTANFDGVKKNQTKILDGAFIGSDSVLIAPVKIGKKSIIGAGSVVTKGRIADGVTAVGVPAQSITRKKSK